MLLTGKAGSRLGRLKQQTSITTTKMGAWTTRTVLSVLRSCSGQIVDAGKAAGGGHFLLVDVAGLFSFGLRDPSSWLERPIFKSLSWPFPPCH